MLTLHNYCWKKYPVCLLWRCWHCKLELLIYLYSMALCSVNKDVIVKVFFFFFHCTIEEKIKTSCCVAWNWISSACLCLPLLMLLFIETRVTEEPEISFLSTFPNYKNTLSPKYLEPSINVEGKGGCAEIASIILKSTMIDRANGLYVYMWKQLKSLLMETVSVWSRLAWDMYKTLS